MSIPGTWRATSTLITSSSRGGGTRSGGVRSQSASSWRAGGGDPVALLRSLPPIVGLDETVPLEALQRRVHLPDVERPHLARPRLELVLQPQTVLRPLAQQGEHRMRDAHDRLSDVCILGSILSMQACANGRGAM